MKPGSALKKHAIPIALGVAMLLVFLLHAAKMVNIPLQPDVQQYMWVRLPPDMYG